MKALKVLSLQMIEYGLKTLGASIIYSIHFLKKIRGMGGIVLTIVLFAKAPYNILTYSLLELSRNYWYAIISTKISIASIYIAAKIQIKQG